jgi:error-prone DNA polymerase
MREIEAKLRAGMTTNGIAPKTQDQIVKFIGAFAEFGFPESHAASFALIAYASAFLKVRYPAAFTAALLNNWPMGFYHPATIVNDAKRKGVRVRYADVARSDWNCSLECSSDGRTELRIGLRYVRGLQQTAAEALLRQRSYGQFVSVADLARRVPELSHDNLAMLARIGALNNLCDYAKFHRRDALWEVEKAVRASGSLLKTIVEPDSVSPLKRMSVEERLVADYYGVGLTTGRHPVAYWREELRRRGIKSAAEIRVTPDGRQATTAGCVIVRQRPGTAKGVIFMTLEDETETSRIIIWPTFYEQNRMTVLKNRFVLVSGVVQNQDGVVHLMARHIEPLQISAAALPSHNFR